MSFLPLLQNIETDLAKGALGAGILAFIMAFAVFFIILAVALYIYLSLTLMIVAKRLETEPAWLAWIPVGNLVLMSKMAKMHWWPLLLLIGFFIPFVGFLASIALTVFVFMQMWKICEARGKPGWWALLTLIPFAGPIWCLVMWGILAWGK